MIHIANSVSKGTSSKIINVLIIVLDQLILTPQPFNVKTVSLVAVNVYLKLIAVNVNHMHIFITITVIFNYVQKAFMEVTYRITPEFVYPVIQTV